MPDTGTPSLRRARDDKEKQARRQAILDAARHLFVESDGEAPPVDRVAKRAGMAKGTVYLYFAAKEEIFLALLMQELGQWAESLAAILRQTPPDSGVLARRMTLDLADRRIMLRLAAQCHGTLERHVPEAALIAFKQTVAESLTRLGDRVEDAFPDLGQAPGAGAQLLVQIYALIIGLWQLADPPRSVRDIAGRVAFGALRPDFAATVEPGLAALLDAAISKQPRIG